MVDKALKKFGSSVKKIDSFARTLGKSMSITAGKNGGVEAEGGGVKLSIQRYGKDEVGSRLSGRVAFVEGATSTIGGKGTESVGQLAKTLIKAGRDLGVDHIMVALDTMDRLEEDTFVDAGFTHSIAADDATRVTMIKSFGKKSSKRYDEFLDFYRERRGFCPTGPGGGLDNSCGGKGDYKEWSKGDHKDKSKEKDAQEFLDKAREGQLARGGKDGGKADDGGGVQTWSKGEHYPWTAKQVGDKEGYVQGQHPDGSKTEQYPFTNGDTTEAFKKLSEEVKGRIKKRSVDPRQVIDDTLRFLKGRR
jgi:hypothetical protein